MQTGRDPANKSGLPLPHSPLASDAPTPASAADRRTFGAEAGLPGDVEDAWTIEEFALLADLTEDEVWEGLKVGQLTGRMRLGQILVYGPIPLRAAPEQEPVAPLSAEAQAYGAVAAEGELPPLPLATDELDDFEGPPRRFETAVLPHAASLAVRPESQVAPEIALLLDHLSLAKEENREILRMTQQSIRKVTELSEQLVEGKEQLIRAKDVEIHALRDAIDVQRREITRLRQQHEDLEMLARTLSTSGEREPG